MRLDRRQVLAATGACLALGGRAPAAGRAPLAQAPALPPSRLDALLAAHALVLPEREGVGANHYPMAAEALEALGREDAIPASWSEGAAPYAGTLRQDAPLGGGGVEAALGVYERFGDWLARFEAELEREDWRAVVARWAPLLAPGLCGAAFHGSIRTAHAVRALARRESEARRHELAVGLAYWAARHRRLPARGSQPADDLRAPLLAGLEHPWLTDEADVDFDAVTERMASRPLAPAPRPLDPARSPERSGAHAELEWVVREAATGFLEMLVAERQRIWLLHAVTGPAAVEPLLPLVDERTAHALVGHARQATVALFAAFGAPFRPREHVRAAPPPWSELVERAASTSSVHTIKLVEVLARFDRGDDPLWRSVAVQWLEWT